MSFTRIKKESQATSLPHVKIKIGGRALAFTTRPYKDRSYWAPLHSPSYMHVNPRKILYYCSAWRMTQRYDSTHRSIPCQCARRIAQQIISLPVPIRVRPKGQGHGQLTYAATSREMDLYCIGHTRAVAVPSPGGVPRARSCATLYQGAVLSLTKADLTHRRHWRWILNNS